MKENNVYAIKYFKILFNNGLINSLDLINKIKEIEAQIKKTKNLHKQKLLMTQKKILEEVLR